MADFHVVDIGFDSDIGSCHKLFYKKHITQERNVNTLFLTNIPPYCNEDGLRKVFSDCGIITSISITQNPTKSTEDSSDPKLLSMIRRVNHNFKYAYITFKEESSIDVALQISSSSAQRYLSTESSNIGMNSWIKHYSSLYPKESMIQELVNKYMLKFDQEQAQMEELKKQQGKMDDDGWTTVPVKKRPVQDINTKQSKKLEKKKRNEKELMSFYLFQQRDEKRGKIATMRQKFEEDKKRITQMRQERKFKPF